MERFDKKKIILVIVLHVVIFTSIILLAVFVGCPVRKIFSVPCPCCGMSRAYLSAFKLDFKSAFSYHPLFLVFPFALFFIFHRNVFNFHINKKVQKVIVIFIVLLFIAVYLVRLFIFHDNF